MQTVGTVDRTRSPWPEPPAPGEARPVAEGVLWMRLPLPLRLDHVNCYALEDEQGWTLVDTGFGDDATFAVWEALLAGPLVARPVRQVIVTHFHPDHAGAAGWLLRRTGAELAMSRSEFLMTLLRKAGTAPEAGELEAAFFRRHGAADEVLATVARREERFQAAVAPLPPMARILSDGDELRIGRRDWRVITAGGHAPEQVMLLSADGSLLLSADQLIDRISPTIPSSYLEPFEDPLGHYLQALARLRSLLSAEVLALPGHKLPFLGAVTRIDELADHHDRSLDALWTACRDRPRSASALIPVLYSRSLGPDGQALAISEIVSHLVRLCRIGMAEELAGSNGLHSFRSLP